MDNKSPLEDKHATGGSVVKTFHEWKADCIKEHSIRNGIFTFMPRRWYYQKYGNYIKKGRVLREG